MARMELISGIERRRRWPDDVKLRIVAEANQPGVRIGDVARRHDIYPAQIRLWRNAFAEFGVPGALVPVNIVDESGVRNDVAPMGLSNGAAAAPVVEITLRKGRGLKVPADIDPRTLTSLIVCVEAA